MKITHHTADKLVIESRPKVSFGIAITLGALALLASLYALVASGGTFSVDTVFGLVLGPLFLSGGLLLYTETTTTLDRRSGTVTWEQRGLVIKRSDTARLEQIRDVTVGRPVSDQSGGASRVNLVLADRVLPLMFGFSAVNSDARIRDAIVDFLDRARAR